MSSQVYSFKVCVFHAFIFQREIPESSNLTAKENIKIKFIVPVPQYH